MLAWGADIVDVGGVSGVERGERHPQSQVAGHHALIVDEELEDALKCFRQPTAVAVAAKDAVLVQHDSAYHWPKTQTSSTAATRPVGCFDMCIGDRLD